MGNKRNTFDLPVDGFDDRKIHLGYLTCAFERAAISDPETALHMGKYLEESRYTPGRIAYCHFLWSSAASVSVPRAKRYAEAERILLDIRRDLDLSDQLEAELSSELAGLYQVTGRPVGALAALLRAKRFGASVAEYDMERCRRKLQSIDINHLGDNPDDAFALAAELEILHYDRLTELFYQLATEKGDKIKRAKAALCLADHYSRKGHENSASDDAGKYYAMAEALGFPELLSW